MQIPKKGASEEELFAAMQDFRRGHLPGMLVRIEADGTRTVGRFVNRHFEAAD